MYHTRARADSVIASTLVCAHLRTLCEVHSLLLSQYGLLEPRVVGTPMDIDAEAFPRSRRAAPDFLIYGHQLLRFTRIKFDVGGNGTLD